MLTEHLITPALISQEPNFAEVLAERIQSRNARIITEACGQLRECFQTLSPEDFTELLRRVLDHLLLLWEGNPDDAQPSQRRKLCRAVFRATGKRLLHFIAPAIEEKAEFIPTPAQIAEECRAIQAEWSRFERKRREKAAFGLPVHYTVPMAHHCRRRER